MAMFTALPFTVMEGPVAAAAGVSAAAPRAAAATAGSEKKAIRNRVLPISAPTWDGLLPMSRPQRAGAARAIRLLRDESAGGVVSLGKGTADAREHGIDVAPLPGSMIHDQAG